MTSLIRRTRLTTFAFVLALCLTILPGLVAPFMSGDTASWFPIPTEALADDAQDGTG